MIRKGEIYAIDRYQGGAKDRGRLLLVLSNEENVKATGVCVVAPLVGKERFKASSHAEIKHYTENPMYAILERMGHVSERQLKKRVGKICVQDMTRVEAAICRMLEL